MPDATLSMSMLVGVNVHIYCCMYNLGDAYRWKSDVLSYLMASSSILCAASLEGEGMAGSDALRSTARIFSCLGCQVDTARAAMPFSTSPSAAW